MNPWKLFPKFGNCSSRRMNGHMQLGLVSLIGYITGKNQFYITGKKAKQIPEGVKIIHIYLIPMSN